MNALITTVGASLNRSKNLTSEQLAGYLLNLSNPNKTKDFGAEICSIASIINRPLIFEREYLYLLASDTENGRRIGEALRIFFEKSPELSFKTVVLKIVTDLDDARPKEFQNKGLRNVVKEIAEIYKHHIDHLAINATGGFKAQIALAQAFGMAVKVPVYYKFETFDGVIEIPPMPISLDVELWLENKGLLDTLEMNSVINERDLEVEYDYRVNFSALPPEIKLLIDREQDSVGYMLSLSPMGEVFVQACRLSLDKMDVDVSLKESTVAPDRKLKKSSKEAHSNKQISDNQSFVNKLLAIPFVEEVGVRGSSQLFERNEFVCKQFGEIIKARYSTRGGTLYMEIRTTARNPYELEKAVEEIQRQLI